MLPPQRLLEDDGNNGTMEPTPAPTSMPPPQSGGGGILFGFFLVVVSIFIGWRLLVRWRHRREQRLLDMRSAQASRVLGDMQMVPNEDLDDGLI